MTNFRQMQIFAKIYFWQKKVAKKFLILQNIYKKITIFVLYLREQTHEQLNKPYFFYSFKTPTNMLLATQIAAKGHNTLYRNAAISELHGLSEKNQSVPKTQRPLLKFEEGEKIAVLDFDTYKNHVGKELDTENYNIIQKCRSVFGQSIVFEGISPSNGIKIAVKFNSDATREELISFLNKNFDFDLKGSGFVNNCFLPTFFISVNETYTPFELPKGEKPATDYITQTSQPKKGLYTLAQIAAKYAQKSKKANASINAFAISAYRNGFSEKAAIEFAQTVYTGTDIKKHIKDAFEYAAKSKKITPAPAPAPANTNAPFIEFENQNDFAKKASQIIKSLLSKKDKYFAIQAPTGSGKTFLFTDILNDYFKKEAITVLFLVPTQAIAAQNSGIFGKIETTDLDAERQILEEGGIIVTTYDKAEIFAANCRKNNTFVVIDEAHEFANCESYRKNAAISVKKAINKASKVLYLSATLPNTFLSLQRNIEKYVFTPKKRVKKSIKLTHYAGDVSDVIAEKILPIALKNKENGVVTAIQIDNKDVIKDSIAFFEKSGMTVSAIYNHVDLDFDENYKAILGAENKVCTDVLLCTKKINAGVNLRNEKMHFVYFSDLADKQGTNEFDVVQFFGRGRANTNFKFDAFERKAKNASEKKELTDAQKVDFIDIQQSKVRTANREVRAGFPQTVDPFSFNIHGGFFLNCIEFNEAQNEYELSYSKIAMYFDADKRRNTDFQHRLTEIDNSYTFEQAETVECAKSCENKETRAEKNAREITEIKKIIETDLDSNDKIKKVAKLSKNKQVKHFFSGAFLPCDVANIEGAELILIFAAKLLHIGYTEKAAFAAFLGKTYAEIETLINDAQNEFRYSSVPKNADERLQKRFLEKMITACGKKEITTLIDLKKEIRAQFSNHNEYYGLRLCKLDIAKIREICGFAFDFEYLKKEKAYKITRKV